MYLIIGLGNPESDYANTRHNMGFNVINKLSEKYGISVNSNKFKALCGTGIINNKKVMLLKPQTFMNLSGQAIRDAVNYYKISLDDIIVIYDDIDLEPGLIRIRKSGGAGTHNGMKSVIDELNSKDFVRIRVGIGKPDSGDLIEYVIGAINEEDKPKLAEGIEKAALAVQEIIENNIDIAMNKFN